MADANNSTSSSGSASIQIVKPKISPDMTTIFGIILTFGLIATAIMIGKSNANFFNVPSFLIVILGTLTVTSISYSWEELVGARKVIANTLFRKRLKPSAVAIQLMNIASLAKTKGLLSLAKLESEFRKDPNLHTAVQMVTDGYTPEDIDRILSQDLDALVERHRRSASILRRASEISPAMGLIGTLIGLVQMLADLQNPETIGPSMAVALLTTFYGAILGTAVLAPMAAKLERNSNDETMIRTLTLMTMSSIARQDNPRHLEMLLNSELPPSQRISYFD